MGHAIHLPTLRRTLGHQRFCEVNRPLDVLSTKKRKFILLSLQVPNVNNYYPINKHNICYSKIPTNKQKKKPKYTKKTKKEFAACNAEKTVQTLRVRSSVLRRYESIIRRTAESISQCLPIGNNFA